MKKSKHLRKDVIIARVIFLGLCVLILAGVVWLVSFIATLFQKPDDEPKESQSSQIEESQPSESEDDSMIDSQLPSESESDSATVEPVDPPKMFVEVTSKSNLNLRKEPNTKSTVLTSLPKGTKVEVIEELDGWYKVTYKKHTGYISADYVKVLEE